MLVQCPLEQTGLRWDSAYSWAQELPWQCLLSLHMQRQQQILSQGQPSLPLVLLLAPVHHGCWRPAADAAQQRSESEHRGVGQQQATLGARLVPALPPHAGPSAQQPAAHCLWWLLPLLLQVEAAL